jgi:DNA adenine methylase
MAVVAEAGQERDSLAPPLKWAGGKRWLVPRLAQLWSGHRERRLVEPFCGGLAITLGLQPDRALLNDINPHALNFYRWLKRGFEIDASLEFANDATVYYRNRARFNRIVAEGGAASAEAASLFYFLNRTCYNGLCRFNASGLFNVPFGRYVRINYERDFGRFRPAFRTWRFARGDFEQMAVAPDDFIYADPPYDVEFTRYAKEDFGWRDHVRLARWLSRHRGPVVLSNQATPRVVKLYRELGFKLSYLSAPRRIDCTGDRTPAREVLAVRNL